MRIAFLGLTALVLSLTSCALTGRMPANVSRSMTGADEVTLFSLQPEPVADATDLSAGRFHGHKVLGSVRVSGADRVRLLTALRTGVADHDGSVAACFIPHHGIRLKAGEKTTDLVVCFQCYQVKVYEGGGESSFRVSRSPRDTFNEILDKAKVPVADAGRR